MKPPVYPNSKLVPLHYSDLAIAYEFALKSALNNTTITDEYKKDFGVRDIDYSMFADWFTQKLWGVDETDQFGIKEVPTPSTFKLTNDQQNAYNSIMAWYNSEGSSSYVLKGPAGTGKSYLMYLLFQNIKTSLFTATTNKATQVLQDLLGVKCKTIYSALGLRMSDDSEKQNIVQESEPYFAKNTLIVLDEAGFTSRELANIIERVRMMYKLKVLYVGDPFQLPPINESKSIIWRLSSENNTSTLREPVRFDNELLILAQKLRKCISTKNYNTPLLESITSNNKGLIMVDSQRDFVAGYLDSYRTGENSKAIAWRNKTVNNYNDLVREYMGYTSTYCDGESILVAKPVMHNGSVLAYIDEEFTINRVGNSMQAAVVPSTGRVVDRVATWSLQVTNPTQSLELHVPKHPEVVSSILSDLAGIAHNASNKRVAWKDFWAVAQQFHSVRYGYALTAHRAQGSTLKQPVYVDQSDILVNRDKRTAFKCLYVACTRAVDTVISF